MQRRMAHKILTRARSVVPDLEDRHIALWLGYPDHLWLGRACVGFILRLTPPQLEEVSVSPFRVADPSFLRDALQANGLEYHILWIIGTKRTSLFQEIRHLMQATEANSVSWWNRTDTRFYRRDRYVT